MNRIILIETSTSLCSTALVEDGRIISERISGEPRAHASKTALFVSEMLSEKGLKVSDCDAVAVSKGPGSYTGFGVGIPMISVGTLDTLVWQALDGNMLPDGCRYIVPMIDARRMEVYTGIFTPDGKQVSPTEARIIDPDSFKDQLAEGPVLFIGDGAGKCQETLTSPEARFIQCCPKAASMVRPATEALNAKRFEDVAYFEPFYLKEFMTTVSKRKII